MRNILATLFAGTAFLCNMVLADEYTVDQKGNMFNQTVLKIKVGGTVNFRNLDAHYHHVFSLTEGHTFDLGSYGQGQTRKHTFNTPGKLDVECAIHPKMRFTIEVSK